MPDEMVEIETAAPAVDATAAAAPVAGDKDKGDKK